MKHRLAACTLAALSFLGFSSSLVAEVTNHAAHAAAVAADARNYCRFTGDDFRGKLEIAVITMKNAAGVTVELVGAVHIADAAYYEALNELFKTYEVLLFELVDGQSLKDEFGGKRERPGKKKTVEVAPKAAEKPVAGGKKANAEDAEEAGDEGPLVEPRKRAKDDVAFKILHSMMTGLGSYLKLQFQTDGVDYHAKNFVHADVSMAEFQRLQEEKGESWVKLFQKSIQAQLKRGSRPEEEPSTAQLILALLGDSSGIKISMAKMLGKLETMSEDVGFGADSVIVGERNRVALEVFDKEVKAGRKNLGIFYGAAHLPDMEKRMEARGYKRTGERWMVAWDIKPSADRKK